MYWGGFFVGTGDGMAGFAGDGLVMNDELDWWEIDGGGGAVRPLSLCSLEGVLRVTGSGPGYDAGYATAAPDTVDKAARRTGMASSAQMASDEELAVSTERLRDLVDRVRILAADADTQNAWLHPCGWTKDEPYEHVKSHRPCAPIAELVDSFVDMWPAWRAVVAPSLSMDGERALDRLATRLKQLDQNAYRDELDTLNGGQWTDVRHLASEILAQLA
jgi:hypothetical protein